MVIQSHGAYIILAWMPHDATTVGPHAFAGDVTPTIANRSSEILNTQLLIIRN